MCLLAVILVFLARIMVVAMKERRVVVLVAVIVRAVIERAERSAGVVVGHVVVIVGVDLRWVQMLLLVRFCSDGGLSAGAGSLMRHRPCLAVRYQRRSMQNGCPKDELQLNLLREMGVT
ncbi:MAG: hypothetical protein ACRDG7_00525 [Candidatus Limnocylindria bacterium]